MAASAPDKGHALTVAWSVPELFKDDPKTFASDVYALAITAWEVFERLVPFGNMPEAAVVSQVLAGVRPNLLRHTPADIQEIIKLAWSSEANVRVAASQFAWVLSNKLTADEQDATPSREDEERVAGSDHHV